jgi:hydrogenase expression/formation protein HypC
MCLAIPAKIVSTEGEDIMRTGRVDFGGVVKEVNLAFAPEAAIGDYVLVHVGFALSKVDEEEAQRTYEILKEMNQLAELEESPAEPAPAPAQPKGGAP